MKKSLTVYIKLLILSITISSCGGGGSDDGPPPPLPNEPPSVVENLIFPSPNLLCIDNNVAFDWTDAIDPEGGSVRYRILIARDRDLTQIEEERIVNISEVTISLQIATAFYWNVVSLDNSNTESDPTPTQAFFTMGEGDVNNVPFTAALVSPEDQGNVAPGMVALSWTGGDSNPADTLIYDVFFGTDPNPPLLATGTGISVETFDVDASMTATTYYWRIDSTDDSGAKSIGQVWQFTTN